MRRSKEMKDCHSSAGTPEFDSGDDVCPHSGPSSEDATQVVAEKPTGSQKVVLMALRVFIYMSALTLGAYAVSKLFSLDYFLGADPVFPLFPSRAVAVVGALAEIGVALFLLREKDIVKSFAFLGVFALLVGLYRWALAEISGFDAPCKCMGEFGTSLFGTAMRASKFSALLLCVWIVVSAVVIVFGRRYVRRSSAFFLTTLTYFVAGGTDLLAALNFTADYEAELRTHLRASVHSQVIKGSISFGEDGWQIRSKYEAEGTNSNSIGMEKVSWKQYGTFWDMVVADPALSNDASAATVFRDDFPYLPSAIDGALWLGYCSFKSDLLHSPDGYVPVPTDGPISEPVAHVCRMQAEWFPGKFGLIRSATFITDKDRIANAHENPMLRSEVFVRSERRKMLTPLTGRIVPNVTRLEYAASEFTTNNGVIIPLQFNVRAFKILVNRNPNTVEDEARIAWEILGRLNSLEQANQLPEVPTPRTGKESVWIADYRIPDNKYAISQVAYEVPYGEFPPSNAAVVVEAFNAKLQKAKAHARTAFLKRLGFYSLMLVVAVVPIWFLFRNQSVKNKLAKA